MNVMLAPRLRAQARAPWGLVFPKGPSSLANPSSPRKTLLPISLMIPHFPLQLLQQPQWNKNAPHSNGVAFSEAQLLLLNLNTIRTGNLPNALDELTTVLSHPCTVLSWWMRLPSNSQSTRNLEITCQQAQGHLNRCAWVRGFLKARNSWRVISRVHRPSLFPQ